MPTSARLQLGIEFGNHLLKCGNGLLYRGNLHQLPSTHRAAAILQGADKVAPLLLELNERQAVIRQISHRDTPPPVSDKRHDSRMPLPSDYRSTENFSQLRQENMR